MAEENCDWGYRRIRGALSNLGHDLARSTIAEILARHGIEPAPERVRKTTWKEFLTRYWEFIVAADFFTVEVWTRRGLQRFIVLFLIDLSTRKVEIAGIATGAHRLWMSQIGRNLTDVVEGILIKLLRDVTITSAPTVVPHAAAGLLAASRSLPSGVDSGGPQKRTTHSFRKRSHSWCVFWASGLSFI